MINEALTWIDTPYHHQARIKGVGVDCANLIAGIAENCGYPAIILDNYSTQWYLHNDEEKMINILSSYGCVKEEELKAGRIVTFQFGRVSGHIGLMTTDSTFIHADIQVGRVVEVPLSGKWLRRLSGTYRFPEII